MLDNNGILAEELAGAFPHVPGNDVRAALYDLRMRDLLAEASRRDCYRLVGFFDAFCRAAGIEYVAFEDTLVAAVVYHDLLPGSFSVDVAMLREDYLRFEQELCGLAGCEDPAELAGLADSPAGFRVNGFGKGGKARTLTPTVELDRPEVVMQNGAPVFGDDHLPLRAQARITIMILDGIPDDYDLQRILFFRIRALQESQERIGKDPGDLIAQRIWQVADSYNAEPHEQVMRVLPPRSRALLPEELFPARRVPFGPVEICLPNDVSGWINEDVDSVMAQTRCLQEDVLLITQEIDRVCRKLGIGYFVCGGTMLGLVRHGGFIPWDDDMDVGMLRADYERFCALAADELGEQFFLQTRLSDPNIPYLFSKVRLKDTEYITRYNELRDFNKGICVDIFPFDKIPLEYGTFAKHQAKVEELVQTHNHAANGQIPVEKVERRDAKSPLEALGQAVMSKRHERFWNISLAETQQAFVDQVTKYNDDENLHYVASFVPTFTCVRLEDLLPYQDVEFAGVTLKAPARPEVFLQMQYGDFMSVPLPHQQMGHGLVRWKGTKHSSAEFEKKESGPAERGAAGHEATGQDAADATAGPGVSGGTEVRP